MNSADCTCKHIATGLALLLILMSSASPRADVLKLTNRPAAIVIPLIEPALESGETITGSGQSVDLRASPTRIRKLQRLVESVDQPLQLLQITVYSGMMPPAVRQSQTGLGKKNYATRTRSTKNHPPAQVSVLEGNEVYIEREKSVPLVEQAVIIDDVQTLTRNSIDYERRRDGFSAMPLLRGNTVLLRITAVHGEPDQRNGGTWSTTTVSTTISGKLGEWIRLSGVARRDNQPNKTTREIRGKTRTRDPEQVWVRVDTAMSAVEP